MPDANSARAARMPKRATPSARIPRRIAQPTLDDHLEVMTRAIFQAGLSWAMIASRWDRFREAFEAFDVTRVAGYGPFDIDRLMHTDGIVHSEKKLTGTVYNANALVALNQEFGSVTKYNESFDSYAALVSDARSRFAFLGDLSCYYWHFRTGNRVPRFEDWIAGQPKDHPRVREMVLTARAENASPECSGF
jgi:3-methyladenine DNA glycosylase Tag